MSTPQACDGWDGTNPTTDGHHYVCWRRRGNEVEFHIHRVTDPAAGLAYLGDVLDRAEERLARLGEMTVEIPVLPPELVERLADEDET